MNTTAQWRYVTDGGLETDLIFHHGVDLPEFAAYPLVWTDEGRALLRSYYDGYADIAGAVGAGLRLESPTWRANPDWAALLGTRRTHGLRREPGRCRAPAGDGARVARPGARHRGDRDGRAARRRVRRGRCRRRRRGGRLPLAPGARVRRGGRPGRVCADSDRPRRGGRGGARVRLVRAPGRHRLHGRDRRAAARRHHPAVGDRAGRRRRAAGVLPRQLRPPAARGLGLRRRRCRGWSG